VPLVTERQAATGANSEGAARSNEISSAERMDGDRWRDCAAYGQRSRLAAEAALGCVNHCAVVADINRLDILHRKNIRHGVRD